jgi:hypothetical protein
MKIALRPEAGLSTEIVGKSGKFLACEKWSSKHHKLPPIHHILTIKKPRSTTRFLKKSLKKRLFACQKKIEKTYRTTPA